MQRLKKNRNRIRSATMRIPATLTPRLGTKFGSIRRSMEKASIRVPARRASVAFNTGSRYQSRIYRGENVPFTICTIRVVTVTTKPVRAAAAPTIALRTVLAVEDEY
jgi:hypothetical protein